MQRIQVVFRIPLEKMVLIKVLIAVMLVAVSRAQPQCPSIPLSPGGRQVTIDLRRNHTGHWLTEVGLRNEGARQVLSANAWSVCVDQTTISCSGKPMLETIVKLTAPPPRAGPDYELFPAVGLYKFHSKADTFTNAVQICAQEGAHLAIPNSEMEVAVYKALFARFPKIDNASHNDWAWVGIHKQGTKTDYFTIFGEPLSQTGFNRFSPGDGKDGRVNDALLVNRDSGGLGDAPVTWIAAFICEQELW